MDAPMGSPPPPLKIEPPHLSLKNGAPFWEVNLRKKVLILKTVIKSHVWIFICYLAAPWQPLGHYQGGQPHSMLITAFLSIFDPRVTSYIRSIYVLCLRGMIKITQTSTNFSQNIHFLTVLDSGTFPVRQKRFSTKSIKSIGGTLLGQV